MDVFVGGVSCHFQPQRGNRAGAGHLHLANQFRINSTSFHSLSSATYISISFILILRYSPKSIQQKKLTDMGFIKAATFVQRRRDTTIRKGRQVLFSAKENKDEPMSSSVVSTLLKGITKKIRSVKRVAAHSARKGAAVEALLSGLPIVTIQSFGGWQDMRTLERY